MNINKEKINDYVQATNNRKSYLIEDFKKTSKLTVEEFIYIADHLERLRKGERNVNID